MMPQDFMQKVKEDIKVRREGRIPSRGFPEKMFNLLTRNGFVIYMPSDSTKILNCEAGTEKIVPEEELSKVFMGYRPKEIQREIELKNQRRIDEYG